MDQQQPKRGLGALLQVTTAGTGPIADAVQVVRLRLSAIRPNQNQPRKSFNEESLAELAQSITSKGLIQPIVVRALSPAELSGEAKYEIVTGERRWRAAQKAGMPDIPAIVKPVSGASDVLLTSLIENIQRDDLNPIESARAYKRLNDAYGMTHDQIASVLGKSRVAITNALRLLDLPDEVQAALADGTITPGHAKVILSLDGERDRLQAYQDCRNDRLTVRGLEELVARRQAKPVQKGQGGLGKIRTKPAHVKEIEDRLSQHFGTKVTVEEGARRGRIVIEFYTVSDFDAILMKLGIS